MASENLHLMKVSGRRSLSQVRSPAGKEDVHYSVLKWPEEQILKLGLILPLKRRCISHIG